MNSHPRRLGHPPSAPASRAGRVVPALGVGLIWLFLLVFLVYPLARILYDAFSDEAGRLTLANFVEFARDRFYRLTGELAAARDRPPWRRPRCWAFGSRSSSSAALRRPQSLSYLS